MLTNTAVGGEMSSSSSAHITQRRREWDVLYMTNSHSSSACNQLCVDTASTAKYLFQTDLVSSGGEHFIYFLSDYVLFRGLPVPYSMCSAWYVEGKQSNSSTSSRLAWFGCCKPAADLWKSSTSLRNTTVEDQFSGAKTLLWINEQCDFYRPSSLSTFLTVCVSLQSDFSQFSIVWDVPLGPEKQRCDMNTHFLWHKLSSEGGSVQQELLTHLPSVRFPLRCLDFLTWKRNRQTKSTPNMCAVSTNARPAREGRLVKGEGL